MRAFSSNDGGKKEGHQNLRLIAYSENVLE